jgi:uncharacterized protein (TIGR00255 family)
MTGFGRAENATNTIVARVEAASVNRKQGEVMVKLPRAYAELESDIRKTAMQMISRGRVSINIHLEKAQGATSAIRINSSRARALEAAFTELSDTIDRHIQASATDFLRTPEILEFDHEPADPDEALSAITPALNAALQQMISMRADEGGHLHTDTENRITSLENITQKIEIEAPSVMVSIKKTFTEDSLSRDSS